MSAEELRQYCASVSAFQLKVQIRFKNGLEAKTGRIRIADSDGIELITEDNSSQRLPYAWIARIRNA